MTSRIHHPYRGLQWSVVSQFGAGSGVDALAAGALELGCPYFKDKGIPVDFDETSRFIDRTFPFMNIAISEVGFDGLPTDMGLLKLTGLSILSSGTLTELPSANLNGISAEDLARRMSMGVAAVNHLGGYR